MMKSCSITNAVFLACRMNLGGDIVRRAALSVDGRANVPLDDLACDDTLLGVEETKSQVSTSF